MTGFLKKELIILSLTSALLIAAPIDIWAGNWVSGEQGQWFYEDNGMVITGWQEISNEWYYFNSQGIMATGWVKVPGEEKWYYLDEKNGNWIQKPVIDEAAACHLLDNAIKAAGYYQAEDRELEFKVDYVTKDMIRVSIGYEKLPGIFVTINTYEINRKQAAARSVTRDQLYQLY